MIGARVLAAVAGLALVPFGNVSELLKKQNPWRGFDAQDALLIVVRAQVIDSGGACASWRQAVTESVVGSEWRETPQAWAPWEPWTEEERKSIRECDHQPCAVKLGDPEVASLKALSEEKRQPQYLRMIQARVRAYLARQERHEYEFAGAPVDPWEYFSKRGFVSGLQRPESPHLVLRRLEFAPDQARALHQVLDYRVASSEREAALWVRDVYDDHYFDSWGEWTQVSCEEGGGVRLIQALFLEFDLLKKGDLVSRMMRGKMRDAVESQGETYLNRSFEKLRSAAASISLRSNKPPAH